MATTKTISRTDLFHRESGDEAIIYIDAWENEKDHSVLEIRGTLLEWGHVQMTLVSGIKVSESHYKPFGYGADASVFSSEVNAIGVVIQTLTDSLRTRWYDDVDRRYAVPFRMAKLVAEVEKLNKEVKIG